MCASRMTLPPFQYSRGGLITRPLRDTFVEEEEEAGGQESAAEERMNMQGKQSCCLWILLCSAFIAALIYSWSFFLALTCLERFLLVLFHTTVACRTLRCCLSHDASPFTVPFCFPVGVATSKQNPALQKSSFEWPTYLQIWLSCNSLFILCIIFSILSKSSHVSYFLDSDRNFS